MRSHDSLSKGLQGEQVVASFPSGRRSRRALKRNCPGPGPGTAKCLAHNIQMGGWGQEKAGMCPEDSGESATGLGREPRSDSETWPGVVSPLRTAAGHLLPSLKPPIGAGWGKAGGGGRHLGELSDTTQLRKHCRA